MSGNDAFRLKLLLPVHPERQAEMDTELLIQQMDAGLFPNVPPNSQVADQSETNVGGLGSKLQDLQIQGLGLGLGLDRDQSSNAEQPSSSHSNTNAAKSDNIFQRTMEGIWGSGSPSVASNQPSPQSAQPLVGRLESDPAVGLGNGLPGSKRKSKKGRKHKH